MKDGYIATLHQFGIMTHQVFHQLSRQMTRLPVSAEAPILLRIIQKNGPLTQKEIAEQLRIKPATLTVRLQRLEKMEYVKREADVNDKRIQRVSITEEGNRVIKEGHDAFDFVAKHAFEDFSEDEVNMLISMIQRINANLEKIDKKGKDSK